MTKDLKTFIPEITEGQRKWLLNELLELVGDPDTRITEWDGPETQVDSIKDELRAVLRTKLKEFIEGRDD